jgi:hypothetical protein
MSGRVLRQFFRDWMAILAVFAMVLAPLGSAVARSLATADHVALAAGLVPPPMCLPDAASGLPASGPIHACDHCLPALSPAPPCLLAAAVSFTFAERLQPADTGPSALLAQLRLPPSTGPPSR